MSCNFNRETLESYALSLLDGNEKASVAAHIAHCTECKSYVMKRHETVGLLSHAFTEEPPEWLVGKTMATLAHRKSVGWFRRHIIPVSVCTSAAVFILLFFIFPDLQTGRAYFQRSSSVQTVAVSRNKSKKQAQSAASLQKNALIDADIPNSEDSSNDENLAAVKSPVRLLLGISFENPVADRSIYSTLGVHEEIAALLL